MKPTFSADTKVLIQGITEPLALYYATQMKAYGTNIVAGVSPGYGDRELEGIPVFDLVEQAIAEIGTIETTIIFVRSSGAMDAALEAIAAGVRQVFLMTNGIPPLDMVRLLRKAETDKTLIVGPGSCGIIVPGKFLLGMQEAQFYTPGGVGILSRSGTLTYEVALELNQAKLGQSIGVSLGNDAIAGSSFHQWLQILDRDEATKAIVLVDQSGSDGSELSADDVSSLTNKPVVAYIAGYYVPEEKQLGDAAAIIATQLSGPLVEVGRRSRQIKAFKQAKVPVADRPSQIPDLVKKALKS